MTWEQVVEKARAFVEQQQRTVLLQSVAVRPMQAARFNALFGRLVYPGDFWIVEFQKVLPLGVAAETPGTVMVEVIPATGEVLEVDVGMHAE